MSYESVGDIAPNFFATVATQKTISNWHGSAKPLSRVKTKKDVADYAAAGWRVCVKQGWIAAADAYWLAFSEIDKGTGAGYVSSRLVPLLRSANSMAAAMVPPPTVDAKQPEVIVEVTPDALPPRTAGFSLGGMSPLMMAAAGAGLWFFVLPALKGKGKKGRSKPRKGKKPRRRPRRKGRR